jgi:ATPase subunit of ABC transporter with duplicated ATPase domains
VATAQRRVEIVTPLSFLLPPSQLPANRTVLRMVDVAAERGGRKLFGPLSFAIVGPERVAIAGPNGAGKTSLIRVATGDLDPITGTVSAQRGRIALLDQHVGLLDPRLSLVENMRAHHPDMAAHQAHEAAARFAFRNREAVRPVGTMSGGERLRAGLAVVFAGPAVPQLLILDEPTNHLDVESIEELEAALGAYDGALLVVSHDDAFLEAIGVTRTITLG